jgi:hypothetical protein
MLDALCSSLRFLVKSPGFTVIAVLVLGIRANATIFSIIKTILAKLLPVSHQHDRDDPQAFGLFISKPPPRSMFRSVRISRRTGNCTSASAPE